MTQSRSLALLGAITLAALIAIPWLLARYQLSIFIDLLIFGNIRNVA